MKRTDLFVFQEIEALVNGTWKAGSDRKGLAEGVCYYDVANLKNYITKQHCFYCRRGERTCDLWRGQGLSMIQTKLKSGQKTNRY